MSHPKEADTAALLAALYLAEVRFIVVGGAAAQLHGATLGTLELDIVHQRDPANVAKLLSLLNELDAFHRYDLQKRRSRPTADMLLGSGQSTFRRRSGHWILFASWRRGRAMTSSCRTPK